MIQLRQIQECVIGTLCVPNMRLRNAASVVARLCRVGRVSCLRGGGGSVRVRSHGTDAASPCCESISRSEAE